MDDSTVGCISKVKKAGYRGAVHCFVEWCELNHLQLYTGKMNDLMVDFRRQKTQRQIKGTCSLLTGVN